MEIRNHLLFDNNGKQVKYVATPNRGGFYVPQYVILHYDAAPNDTSAINWMVSPKSKVSAHLHIDRGGEIVQLAPFNIVCWHAGISAWKGLKGLNQHSIGIEMQNSGKQEYTPLQLMATQEAVKAMIVYYDSIKDVLGHSDIAPGRKIDPGPQFPMAQFKASVLINNAVVAKRTLSDLNLRSGAGTSYSVVSVLPKNTEVNVLENNSSWSKVFVCSNKLQGWVSNKYLI